MLVDARALVSILTREENARRSQTAIATPPQTLTPPMATTETHHTLCLTATPHHGYPHTPPRKGIVFPLPGSFKKIRRGPPTTQADGGPGGHGAPGPNGVHWGVPPGGPHHQENGKTTPHRGCMEGVGAPGSFPLAAPAQPTRPHRP